MPVSKVKSATSVFRLTWWLKAKGAPFRIVPEMAIFLSSGSVYLGTLGIYNSASKP